MSSQVQNICKPDYGYHQKVDFISFLFVQEGFRSLQVKGFLKYF